MVLVDGVDEIDIVIFVGVFLSGDYEMMCEEIMELKEICKEYYLKVIFEIGVLKIVFNIKKVFILFMYFGVDFIKIFIGK